MEYKEFNKKREEVLKLYTDKDGYLSHETLEWIAGMGMEELEEQLNQLNS